MKIRANKKRPDMGPLIDISRNVDYLLISLKMLESVLVVVDIALVF